MLKVANGKIQLTQKSQTVSTPEEIAAEDAEAEEALSDLHGRTSRTLLGSLFSGVGLQKTKKQRKVSATAASRKLAALVSASRMLSFMQSESWLLLFMRLECSVTRIQIQAQSKASRCC